MWAAARSEDGKAHRRRQRAPPQAAAESELQGSGNSSKRAKSRQNMEGVDTGDSRVQKNRRTSELSIERAELGHVLVGAALRQVDRWVEQCTATRLAPPSPRYQALSCLGG